MNNKNVTEKIKISKYKIFLIVIMSLFIVLLGRIAYLQFIKASYLKELSYEQLITNRVISTKRGTISDSTR